MAGVMNSFPGTSPPDSVDAAPPPTERQELLRELVDLTLPMMWMLRTRSQRVLEPFGLRPVKALVLGCIAEGTVSPSELADVVDTTPSLMSGVLGDLEDRGLIKRTHHPDDRRRVHLELTDEGRTTIDAFASAWIESSDERFANLSNAELATLVHLHRKILGQA